MNNKREQREIDLLLWKSGELDPVKTKLLENNLSQEDLKFIQILDDQNQLFNKLNNSPELLASPFVIRPVNSSERQFRVIKLVMSSLVVTLLLVAVFTWKSINEKEKPVISDNKALSDLVVKSKPPENTSSPRKKIKNAPQSKYRKRYLSLKSRHRRMTRLNLIFRPKNST